MAGARLRRLAVDRDAGQRRRGGDGVGRPRRRVGRRWDRRGRGRFRVQAAPWARAAASPEAAALLAAAARSRPAARAAARARPARRAAGGSACAGGVAGGGGVGGRWCRWCGAAAAAAAARAGGAGGAGTYVPPATTRTDTLIDTGWKHLRMDDSGATRDRVRRRGVGVGHAAAHLERDRRTGRRQQLLPRRRLVPAPLHAAGQRRGQAHLPAVRRRQHRRGRLRQRHDGRHAPRRLRALSLRRHRRDDPGQRQRHRRDGVERVGQRRRAAERRLHVFRRPLPRRPRADHGAGPRRRAGFRVVGRLRQRDRTSARTSATLGTGVRVRNDQADGPGGHRRHGRGARRRNDRDASVGVGQRARRARRCCCRLQPRSRTRTCGTASPIRTSTPCTPRSAWAAR